MIYYIYKKNVHKNKCWLFNGLIKCIIKKNKLFYKFKINKSSTTEIIYKEYKKYLSKILIKAESNYHSKYFNDNRYNPKQVWKKINSIIYGQ